MTTKARQWAGPQDPQGLSKGPQHMGLEGVTRLLPENLLPHSLARPVASSRMVGPEGPMKELSMED